MDRSDVQAGSTPGLSSPCRRRPGLGTRPGTGSSGRSWLMRCPARLLPHQGCGVWLGSAMRVCCQPAGLSSNIHFLSD